MAGWRRPPSLRSFRALLLRVPAIAAACDVPKILPPELAFFTDGVLGV